MLKCIHEQQWLPCGPLMWVHWADQRSHDRKTESSFSFKERFISRILFWIFKSRSREWSCNLFQLKFFFILQLDISFPLNSWWLGQPLSASLQPLHPENVFISLVFQVIQRLHLTICPSVTANSSSCPQAAWSYFLIFVLNVLLNQLAAFKGIILKGEINSIVILLWWREGKRGQGIQIFFKSPSESLILFQIIYVRVYIFWIYK